MLPPISAPGRPCRPTLYLRFRLRDQVRQRVPSWSAARADRPGGPPTRCCPRTYMRRCRGRLSGLKRADHRRDDLVDVAFAVARAGIAMARSDGTDRSQRSRQCSSRSSLLGRERLQALVAFEERRFGPKRLDPSQAKCGASREVTEVSSLRWSKLNYHPIILSGLLTEVDR